MRDLSKYFHYLTRFNTVAIAIIGFGVIVAFAATVLSSLWSGWHSDKPVDFAPTSNIAKGGYSYRLDGNATRLAGTSEAIFVLRRWKGEIREYDSNTASGQDVNLLVVNGDNAAGHWLFHGTNQRILARDELHASEIANGNDASPVAALVLTVAEPNTGGAGTTRDLESLYYYRVGSGNAVRFFTADRILATQQFGADRYLVIYEDRNAAGANLYSLYDLKLLSTKPLPSIPE